MGKKQLRIQANDAMHMSHSDLQAIRLEEQAEFIIEKIFNRQRWSAPLRDDLVRTLQAILYQEDRIRREQEEEAAMDGRFKRRAA